MHDPKRLCSPAIAAAALVIGAICAAGSPVEARQVAPQKKQPQQQVPAATKVAPPSEGTPAEQGEIPELVIAGRAVMRLRATAGGLTPQERAFSLRQRLGPILTLPDLRAEDVEVRQERPGQTASIYVRQRLLITVDRNLAQANNTSVGGLAAQWSRNLRATLPQVNVAVRMSGGTSWGASQGAGSPVAKETAP